MKTLHQKVKEHRHKLGPINYRSVSVNEFGTLVDSRIDLLNNRQVEGYLFTWGTRNSYGEKFLKGAFTKSIREHGPGSNSKYEIKFLNQHNQEDPLSLFEVLKEDEIGVYFLTKPLDDIPSADRVIKQIRSGTLNNFSGGFLPVWDKAEWEDSTSSIIYSEAQLFEGSVVSIPADLETYAIRSIEGFEDLQDDIEDFIAQLPRKDRLQARHLFAEQKALINLEPLATKVEALKEETKPPHVATVLDVDFIISNFKL